jgi:acyl carrier protein
MENQEVKSLVIGCIKEYLETNDIKTVVNDNTPLIGSDALVDSMGLVNIIVDVESELLDNGIEISLTSEKAMSRKISPFRSINSLVNFINEQINEPSE